jgi:DNA ligase-1
MGSHVLLAHPYAGDDVTGWYASEKLDGVRAYWDGRCLVTRSGNRNTLAGAPAWFTDRLPRGVELDGELWLGRGMFQECSGIVRRHDWGDDANRILYVCFDAPGVAGGFEERQKHLRHIARNLGLRFVMALDQTELRSDAHMRKMLASVEDKGGEGLVLRAPGSPYVRARSHQCLKVKSFRDDEATVTEHYQGKKGKPGVYADWKGTKIKVANGFRLDGSNRPPVGTVIKFGFFEETRDGKPRFPTYIGVREAS